MTLILAAGCARAQLPGPGDPARLTDLRHLARPTVGERFVLDGLNGDEGRAQSARGEIAGPGVLENLLCLNAGELTIEVDGREVLRCTPQSDWSQLYLEPKPEQRGELPWRWPLVHSGALFGGCCVPIPFRESLRVTASQGQDRLWLTWTKLDAPPEFTFSTEPGSAYLKALALAQPWLEGPVEALPPVEGDREVRAEARCAAGGRAELIALDGPAEVVGMELRILPGALNELRYQVIELTIDGVTSLRMPLLDLVGVSHPWPWAWQPRAGTQAAGIVYPYYRSGGREMREVLVYFKLAVPFARSLRIGLWNRSPKLPSCLSAKLRVAPLEDPHAAGRLCGTSLRLPLPEGGDVPLWHAPAPGRLIGLSMATGGHGRDWAWRRAGRLSLTQEDGPGLCGAGLLPFAVLGTNGNQVVHALTWHHNSLQPTGRCGAGRSFWLDPIELHPGATISYHAEGADGPTDAEVGVVWYAGPGDTYAAPEVPAEIVELPPVWHGQPGRPENGGWWLEAEELAAAAQVTAGHARAETAGALDVFASGDAYLAWNADGPGDRLDLIAPMPESRYLRPWYHRLLFLAGGTFAIELAPPDGEDGQFAFAKSSEAYLDRVLGRATAQAFIDCYDVWPHRQAYRTDLPPMLNPSPGGLGRIRFTCVTKDLRSRGYLLAIDQLGLDAPPPVAEGWVEMESLAAGGGQGVALGLMQYGRTDFHGWGGLQVTGRGQARVELAVISGAAAVNALELRGLAQAGEWTVSVGGAEVTMVTPEGAKEPSVWLLPLGETLEPPGALTLTIRGGTQDGSLLLDAWRPVPAG